MLEKCFKFDDDDKGDSFYLAQKLTFDLKKFHTEKLAFILVKGIFTISASPSRAVDLRIFAHLLRIFTHSCASDVHFSVLYRGELCLECAFLRIRRAFVCEAFVCITATSRRMSSAFRRNATQSVPNCI